MFEFYTNTLEEKYVGDINIYASNDKHELMVILIQCLTQNYFSLTFLFNIGFVLEIFSQEKMDCSVCFLSSLECVLTIAICYLFARLCSLYHFFLTCKTLFLNIRLHWRNRCMIFPERSPL
jgi:hypothetical protein